MHKNFPEVTPSAGRGQVTITDVANAAGVSPSTVSYVITGKRSISVATRRRVEESIRALGYRRNGDALATRPTRIGVLAMAMPPFGGRPVSTETEFFTAASEAAGRHRFHLLLVTHDEGSPVTSTALADAVIVLAVGDDDPRVPILLASGRPAVLIGAPGKHRGLPCVELDFAPAGEDCAAHLADLGHRSIVHLGLPAAPGVRPLHDLTGFLRSSLAIASHRQVRAAFHPCTPSADSVARCLDELLVPGGPTGLVVHDEALLPLILATVERRGLRVPDDLSIVGVCSETVARNHSARLTAVVVPARELGTLAVERAVQQLDGEPVAELELIVPWFVVGDSTQGRKP
ncbi:LacI family DNA-binding transcriptional regulator [Amycolatopsis sp. NPDC051128]|uniref:LacI family DNA-binding transcriptional regulator n=1 Tax=Amycolatopsis sp. NPDC051128 TaxID=3155412 RepID=UPI003415576A